MQPDSGRGKETLVGFKKRALRVREIIKGRELVLQAVDPS